MSFRLLALLSPAHLNLLNDIDYSLFAAGARISPWEAATQGPAVPSCVTAAGLSNCQRRGVFDCLLGKTEAIFKGWLVCFEIGVLPSKITISP